MSSDGIPIQDISDMVGHKSTHVTETVYRQVIRPTIRGGATVMDDVFGDPDDEAENQKTRPAIVIMLVTILSNEFLKSTVELWGFEPLTFCMPCTIVLSGEVRWSLISAAQRAASV